MTTPRSLKDVIPHGLQGDIYRSITDYWNKPVVVKFTKIVKDDRGDKAVFVVTEKDGKDQFYLQTRAAQPVEISKWLVVNKALPMVAKFIMEGNKTLLVDPSTEATAPQQEDQFPFLD